MEKFLTLALSFLLAYFVYTYIENPARHHKTIGKIPVSIVLLLCLIGSVYTSKYIRRTTHDFTSYPAELVQLRKDQVDEMTYDKECDLNVTIPNTGRTPEILFAGDSHMTQYYLRAKRFSQKTGKNVGFLVHRGGSLLYKAKFSDTREGRRVVNRFNEFLMDTSHPRVLVLQQKWGSEEPFHFPENLKVLREGLEQFKKQIRTQKSLKVYVILDNPWDEIKYVEGITDPLRHTNRFHPEKSNYMIDITDIKNEAWKRGNDVVREVLSDVAEILDPVPMVCPQRKCNLLKWYRDDDHLRASAIEKWGTWIDCVFEQSP